MQVQILIGKKHFSSVYGEPTEIPELAITKWRGPEGKGWTLTHIATGRNITLRPLQKAEIPALVRCLKLAEIDWSAIVPGSQAKTFLAERLSKKELRVLGLVA